jgi:hypothetical protein
MAERLSRSGGRRPRPRRGRFFTLVVAVALVHGCVTRDLANRMEGFAAAARMPARIEVAYVRTLEPAAPPVLAPAPPPPPPPPPRRVARARPAKAASSPQRDRRAEPSPERRAAAEAAAQALAASATPSRAEDLPVSEAALYALAQPKAADIPEPAAASAAASAPAASAAALASPASAAPTASDTSRAAASAAASAPRVASAPVVRPAEGVAGTETFDWPASTRVSYDLNGNYRGEVKGYAQVEWIRVGSRYQVNLDFVVGPDFAPIIRRRMTSEGDLTPEGLMPSRYDEDTQAMMRDRRRVTVQFEPEAVVLANGERRERWPGVQDTASQFIQLTFLFTTRPDLLQAGKTIEMPLALPRNTDRWTYDVLEETEVQTSFGPLPAFHLKPRRARPKPGELTAEIWFAPSLRYLPVRIRVEQDAQTWLDLVIARKPELAGR